MDKAVVVSIPHQLGRTEARRRIDEGLTQITAQLGAVGEVQRSWQGDTLHFSVKAIGQTISGKVAVEPDEVRLNVNLPGIFAMIASKVKGRLRHQGQLLLGGPKQG